MLKKLFLYGIFGGSGVMLDGAIYAGLIQLGVWYMWANVAGYIAGTLLSFVLNRAFTFQVKDAPLRRLAMFLGVAAIGFTLSSLVLWMLIDVNHMDPIVAKIISLVVVVVVQFSLNSAITFRRASAN